MSSSRQSEDQSQDTDKVLTIVGAIGLYSIFRRITSLTGTPGEQIGIYGAIVMMSAGGLVHMVSTWRDMGLIVLTVITTVLVALLALAFEEILTRRKDRLEADRIYRDILKKINE